MTDDSRADDEGVDAGPESPDRNPGEAEGTHVGSEPIRATSATGRTVELHPAGYSPQPAETVGSTGSTPGVEGTGGAMEEIFWSTLSRNEKIGFLCSGAAVLGGLTRWGSSGAFSALGGVQGVFVVGAIVSVAMFLVETDYLAISVAGLLGLDLTLALSSLEDILAISGYADYTAVGPGLPVSIVATAVGSSIMMYAWVQNPPDSFKSRLSGRTLDRLLRGTLVLEALVFLLISGAAIATIALGDASFELGMVWYWVGSLALAALFPSMIVSPSQKTTRVLAAAGISMSTFLFVVAQVFATGDASWLGMAVFGGIAYALVGLLSLVDGIYPDADGSFASTL